MYGSITEWGAYALARGNSAPSSATDPDALAALVRASDYVEYNYVNNFLPGYDSTLAVVEYATYEAANLELATPNFFSTTFTPAKQKTLVAVDVIKWQPVKTDNGADAARPMSTKIEAMLGQMVSKDVGLGLLSVGRNYDGS